MQYSASCIWFSYLCVDSKSVSYALQNWDCKVRRDIFYEVKYLTRCIMSRSIGFEFCRVPYLCGLYWNEMSTNLAKQGAIKKKTCLKYSNLLLSSHVTASILEKTVYKELEISQICDTFSFKALSKSNIHVPSKS